MWYGITSAHESFMKQYKLPIINDIIYWGTNRFILTLGAMIMLFIVLIGRFNLAAVVLRSDYLRALSKVTFSGGLVTGIIGTCILCGQETGIYFSGNTSTFMAIGIILISIVMGLLIHIFIEHPLQAVVHMTMVSKLSFARMLKIHQM
jgi:hypothetical protein